MEYDKTTPGGMRLTPEQILKRQVAAQAKKDEFQQLYQDAYEFALPQRQLYGVWEGGATGSKKMQRVFDSTAINSTQRFANRLQSVVFPPQRKWAKLEAGSDIPADRRQQAQAVLEVYQDKMFTMLNQSNFDIAMGEFLLDLAVGTACMMVQPGDDVQPLNFIPVPLFLVSYEEGANGQVDNVYRRMRMKGESIQRQWPDADISDDLKRRIENKPTDDIELLEATIYDHKRGDYCYHVIDKVSKTEIVYRRRKMSPWVISRYMKVAGEIYGRGPLMTALPDIKTLNKVKELLLKNASLAVAGVYTAADDGVLNPNTVKIVPGAIIPVARNGGSQGPALLALPRSVDFMAIDLTKSVQVMVPLHTIGKSQGEKDGGSLQMIRHELEVSCLPTAIPAAIEIDVTAMKIGTVLHVNDLKLPEGVKVPHDVNFTILTVTGATTEEEGQAKA